MLFRSPLWLEYAAATINAENDVSIHTEEAGTFSNIDTGNNEPLRSISDYIQLLINGEYAYNLQTRTSTGKFPSLCRL